LTSATRYAAGLSEAEQEARIQKDEAILVLFGQLALVYWRPDFTPAQAKQLYAQYLDDVRDYSFSDIRQAVEKYRRSPENKFFPTPGQIRGLIEKVPDWDVISRQDHIRERRKDARDELTSVAAVITPQLKGPGH
jgi:hypothetical protein